MQRAAQLIVSQLYSACLTGAAATTQECLKQFAMFWLPPDDSWLDLEIGRVTTILVPKGEEGCDVIIERIEPMNGVEAAKLFADTYAELERRDG